MFVLRAAFLAYFIVNGFNNIPNVDARSKNLAKDYAVLEAHFKKLSGIALPSYLSSSFVTKHAQQITYVFTYAQLTLAFLAVFVPHFTCLVAILELAKAFIAHNGLKFLVAAHPLPEYEPLLIALALFAGSFFFSCCSCNKQAHHKRHLEKTGHEEKHKSKKH